MSNTIELIANNDYSTWTSPQNTLKILENEGVSDFAESVKAAEVVELHFPAFTDGRAFSQAVQLRKRLGFKGDIRATGDVLVDQLVQMQRSGFTSAVLREDQSLEHGKKLLTHYSDFYQGDVANEPAFSTGKLA